LDLFAQISTCLRAEDTDSRLLHLQQAICERGILPGGTVDAFQKLVNSDLDIVMLATPPAYRPMHFEAAVDAKKHIFCEKPMAFTVAECDRMIAAAEQYHVRLMVGQVLWLLPFYSRIVELFDSGLLGKPVAAQVTRTGWFGDPTALYRLRKATTGGQPVPNALTLAYHDVARACGYPRAYAYDNVLVGDMGKVHALVSAANRFHTATISHIWVSEWGWFTDPPNTIVGDSPTTAARYVA